MNGPEKAEVLLEKYLRRYGLYKEYKKREVIIKWNKIVGKEFFHLTPLFFEKDVLICKVNNLSYLDEISSKKEELKEKINTYLREYKIEDIRIIK